MAYVRKTTDEFQVHGDYGSGFEEVTAAATRREARQLLKDYRENEPYPFKIIKKRIKL